MVKDVSISQSPKSRRCVISSVKQNHFRKLLSFLPHRGGGGGGQVNTAKAGR